MATAGLVAFEQSGAAVAVSLFTGFCIRVDKVMLDIFQPAGSHSPAHGFLNAIPFLRVQHQGVHFGVLGVRRRTVIALLVVFDRQLPVRGNGIGFTRRNFQVIEIEHGHRLGKSALRALERWRVITKTDKNKAAKEFQRHRVEAVFFCVEVLLHRTRGDQLAVEVVHPAVVRAFEFSRVAAVFQADERSAMPADIGQGPDSFVFTPHDNGGLVHQVEHEVVAHVGDLRGVACQDPVAGNDTIQL